MLYALKALRPSSHVRKINSFYEHFLYLDNSTEDRLQLSTLQTVFT